MLLLTLRGTPTIYQGEEIGMTDVPIPPEKVQDPWERNVPGLGLGRDPERTPMQWEAGVNAGFSAAEPWLPIAADASTVNVAIQAADPASILSLYRALIRLRRTEPALSVGDYHPRRADESVLCYERQYEDQHLLVALNMSGEAQSLSGLPSGRLLVSTALDRADERANGNLALRPDEGCVIVVE
jgi:alpha-glucosidase